MSLKVVLITGASQGIGLATADHLANAGYKVYATCRTPSNALELQKLSQKNTNISILPLDVTSQDSVDEAINTIFEKEGVIDIAINNAGFGIYGPTEMHTIEEMILIFDTNVMGVMRVNHAIVPIMRNQRHGKIINIGSISGAIPSKGMPLYSASKAALASLTASDAYYLAEWNIKMFLIQPGAVVTNFEPHTYYGTRLDELDNPYINILSEQKEVWKKVMDNGQSPIEVAEVILQVIESSEYQHWHQTSQAVTDAINKHLKDPTGNSRIPQPDPVKTMLHW